MELNERIKKRRKAIGATLDDVGRAIGVSRATVQRWESGEIKNIGHERIAALANALRCSPAYIMGWDEASSGQNDIMPIEVRRIPILGDIACGEPILAHRSYESFAQAGPSINADFALRCKGDSMTGARIQDGDIVFIKRQPDVDDGRIAAVIIDDTATLKRVKRKNGTLFLLAENPAYEPLVYQKDELDSVTILGLAVAFQSGLV